MKVFISYNSQDRKLAWQIADALRNADFQVWDETQLFPGDNWAEVIANELRESDAMVILLTPNSVYSPYMSAEVGYAIGEQGYKGRVIPVIAAPSEEISQLELEIPWILKKFGIIYLSNLEHDEEGLRNITQALKKAAA
ncbi:toll/interleukin-1 receptor domain-containing protein [Nostoc sp. 'Lobaria pulmonaria (5183) cyanobiont']|uniref:toll/interleukin-1 receptor domain-containing protein n=1 Tax=Nostoc sp. 'Lobaria pulmonaria (5183) cyanobiont' TaxID=1618022 RepID=UPI000CF30376|nr:toll/interleukin-1 receptor domain-containing protein [Nostoc sp. 'Lobaria pulmonaria (5183) cyanobiont']AVH73702.1 TIR domain-containing protein [Nostoc sp. 'Lobaria pulmonaria (5183) cyanobiont']